MVPPKVSVLLPFHEPGEFFSDALTSTLHQYGVNFEVVLVANNPDHGSMQTALRMAAAHPIIKLVHENRQGISHALNCGLKHCSGEYIARMDADDIMLPGRLAFQSDYLDANDDTDVVSGLVIEEKEHQELHQTDGMKEYTGTVNDLLTHQSMFHHRFIDAPVIHPSVMFRKKLIDRFGDYNTAEIPEDFEMWLRWFDENVRFAKLNLPVLMWRDHAKRLTRSAPSYSSHAFDLVRMHYLSRFLSNQMKPGKALWIWGAGKYARRKIRLLPADTVPVEGFIDVDLNASVAGFPVMHYTTLPPPGKMFIVSLVSNRGKYHEIRHFLLSKGYEEGVDFVLGA